MTYPLQLHLEVVDLRTFVEETIDEFCEEQPLKKVAFPCPRRVEVSIDVAWFRQLLHNLLRSAGKLAPADTPITVATLPAPRLAVITVHRFGRRVSASRPSPDLGMQLEDESHDFDWSMHVARAIVEAHDGTIWADASVRYGAKYLVALPASTPSERPQVEESFA